MELEIALASVRNSSARPGTDRPQTVENRPDPLLRHVARRTVLQAFAAAVAASPLGRLGIFAQAPPITDAQVATLRAIAEVVLPSAVGRDERDRVVNGFVAWVRNYKEGAEMGHGYGSSTLRQPSGPSPAARYPTQFASLDDAAKTSGGASFAALAAEARRAVIEAALNGPQPVNRLPAQPTGQSLIADFMGFYFTSPDAWDLAYQAQIGRDKCRTLDGSDNAPEPLNRNRERAERVSPRERRGESGVPASERVGGFAGAEPPEQKRVERVIPRERRGESGVPASEREGGFAGVKPPEQS